MGAGGGFVQQQRLAKGGARQPIVDVGDEAGGVGLRAGGGAVGARSREVAQSLRGWVRAVAKTTSGLPSFPTGLADAGGEGWRGWELEKPGTATVPAAVPSLTQIWLPCVPSLATK